MAPKAMKRAASTGGARFAKKCKVIAPALKAADSLPEPVKAILTPSLVNIFGTYKEDRHEFQNACSKLVGATLQATQSQLQEKITEATAAKAAEEAEGATLTGASTEANAAAEAAAAESSSKKEALSNQKDALANAKSALHDLETEVKNADAKQLDTKAKKEKLEASIKEFFTPVAEGTLTKGLGKSATWAAKQLGKEFEDDLQKEFLVCVDRTYSNPSSSWGTFDRIVEKELGKFLQGILTRLAKELTDGEAAVGPRAQKVEAAKAAVAAEEEKVKAAEEVSNTAAAAAKDAAKAAKEAASVANKHQPKIDKASKSLSDAEAAMKAFTDGPLAAYAVVEDNKPPPPKPKPVPIEEPAADSQPAPTVDEAMTAAPPKEQRSTPSVLPSPGVLFQQAAGGIARAVGLSPRIAQSPR